MSNQTPTVGRIVHYTLPNGVVRPAMIVQVWSPGTGCSNLHVHVDGTNDLHHDSDGYRTHVTAEECARGIAWRTSVQCSDEPKPGYWHWPAFVPPKATP